MSKGFIIVKNRVISSNEHEFIPPINLASIHKYSLSTADSRNELKCPSINPHVSNKNIEIVNYSFLSSNKPRLLKDHTTLMVNNIIASIYSSTKDFPMSFEDIMIWVELLRAYSYYNYVSNYKLPSLDKILPKAIFKPWGSETLHVSSWIMSNEFLLSKQVDLDKISNIDGNDAVSISIINQFIGNRESAIITQSKRNSKTIEYVASHFTSSNTNAQVMLLCSMKLRESKSVDPINFLTQIHQFAESIGFGK